LLAEEGINGTIAGLPEGVHAVLAFLRREGFDEAYHLEGGILKYLETVPVLVTLDGRVLDESLDIMLWALEQRNPGQWLTPEQGSRAAMLALIAQCDGEFKFHLDRYKYPERYENVDAQAHRIVGPAFWRSSTRS
jgi:hypothetical protein